MVVEDLIQDGQVEFEENSCDEVDKKDLRSEEFVGWVIAVLFPFAAFGLMEITRIPFLSALIYYGIFGIYLRMKMDGRLPYFRPQMGNVKVEIIFFVLSALLCCYLFLSGESSLQPFNLGIILNLFAFTLLNGAFEHLVWVNIYELAGKRKKYLGVIATTIYVSLIHVFFWLKFLPTGTIKYLVVFVCAQMLILYIPLRIYAKTKDLTLWSIQHIIYNSLTVLFGGFTIWMFLIY